MTVTQSSNTVWHHATVTRQRREAQNGHRAAVIWFTQVMALLRERGVVG